MVLYRIHCADILLCGTSAAWPVTGTTKHISSLLSSVLVDTLLPFCLLYAVLLLNLTALSSIKPSPEPMLNLIACLTDTAPANEYAHLPCSFPASKFNF
ncbi:hypothetical protein BDN70DRAFT_355388 [Pholiota conissans]|uniref:Uncharacterized protein n=1 Tax=Pholiota conissans TaxID=109636 RepID=A0A9P5YQW5_9AGAR|nr:hypothetical protein BDN70DRAFT_355388 [Pholiota conissans]